MKASHYQRNGESQVSQTDFTTTHRSFLLHQNQPRKYLNAFHQGGKSENNGYNRKKFELKNKVQCACCQLAGHTIRAQVKHIQDYSQRHEDIFEENIKRYESMNKTKVVSRVLREDATITNMEELMDATEDRQNPYHETSGE